jgi:hypothetical protein
MNATDDRMARTICPRCGVRLCVDGEDVCLICLDKTMLAPVSAAEHAAEDWFRIDLDGDGEMLPIWIGPEHRSDSDAELSALVRTELMRAAVAHYARAS